MTIPTHWIHIYQKPSLGTAFINRYASYNYQHTIVNQGWFDTASCDIAVRSETEGQQILEQYLGCFVQVFVDNPLVPIWEGLINRITFNSGGASYTIGLDEMANRVSVVYTGAANATGRTTPVDNTASQAIYGIKEDQIEFGQDATAGTARTTLQNTILANRAFPQTSITQGQGNTMLVHFELLGLYHTLEWEKIFSGTSTVATATTTRLLAWLATLLNGSTFFNFADTSQIATNTATTPNQVRNVSFGDYFKKLAEMGDGANYWVTGITPTDPNKGTRVLYYRIANSTIVYNARQSDGLRIRSIFGKYVKPWLVVPDCGIQVTDTLIGYSNTVVSDPTVTYIQSIQYDANSQKVSWAGADNTSAIAAFQLNRGYKPVSRNFGAPLRVIVT